MMISRLFLLFGLTTLLSGCAELFTSQEPAPVYRRRPAIVREEPEFKPIKQPDKPVAANTESIEINALPETNAPAITEIKPEPLVSTTTDPLLTPEQEQDLAALEQAEKNAAEAALEAKPGDLAGAPETISPKDSAPEIVPTTPPEPKEPAFSPLTRFAPLSPAVNALVIAANQNTEQGNLQSATTTIERAIRIEPRNATLYYQLAVLRLKEAKPRLAEDLAKKSALLASNDTQLKKHSWLLIAKARELQKNFDGAKEAKAKADSF